MKLANDRNTPLMDAECIGVPVKAGQTIFAGSIVCVDAAGLAVPGANTAGLTYVGRAEERVSSVGKQDGNVSVLVRRGAAFKWAVDSAIPASKLMKDVFVFDDQTVAATGSVRAGVVVRIEHDGVWVE